MLHHQRLSFRHPHTNELITIDAPLDDHWQQRLQAFDWQV
jgi:tRNA pseudouridine65 synthase